MNRLLRRLKIHHPFTNQYFRRCLSKFGLAPDNILFAIDPTVKNIEPYMRHFRKQTEWPIFMRPELSTLSGGHPGNFGAARKHDIHTGVDLYCKPGTSVLAIEDGVVVGIENFTGPDADDPSPWWNDTKAILVEGHSGVIVYGEVEPDPFLRPGCLVNSGWEIGTVVPVLKEDKGKPMSMLHVELYLPGTRKTVWWKHGEPKPRELLDPTGLLKRAAV